MKQEKKQLRIDRIANFLFGDRYTTYSNTNPSKTEKEMFEKYGLYLVDNTDNIYMYAPFHLKEGYTYQPFIEIEDEMIDWTDKIIFNKSSETVKINRSCDSMLIDLIHERMKELNMK